MYLSVKQILTCHWKVLESNILHELALWGLCFVLTKTFEIYATEECSDIFTYATAPVQTGPGAHPTSCTMGTGSFHGV